MEIQHTELQGLFLLKNKVFQDIRGAFFKSLNFDAFKKNNLDVDFRESYYSISNRNVIRGMHFQTPPFEHTKLVYVSSGEIVDAVVDIRKASPTYGRYFSLVLKAFDGQVLYIPKGFAHGFCALEDNTIVNYLQTSVYSKLHDSGILYNSFGFDWPVENPVISDRDLSFESFKHYKTPF